MDLLFWQTNEHDALVERVRELSAQTGLAQERLLAWCAAFAAMVALEQAEPADLNQAASKRIEMLVELAQAAG